VEEKTIVVLQSDIDLLVKNVTELSMALANANAEIERAVKMSSDWVLKFHAVKLENAELRKSLRDVK
jgi:hypothetical protein